MKKLLIVLCMLLICTGCQVENNTTSSKKNDSSVEITDDAEQKNIIMTNESQASWAINVSDANAIIENSEIVIKGTVVKKEEGTYEYSSKYGIPTTPVELENVSLIYGDEENIPTTILQAGGVVSVGEYIENEHEESVKKSGLDQLTKEEMNNSYIRFEAPGFYELELGQEYIFALKRNDHEMYVLTGNGYGIFETVEEGLPQRSVLINE